MNRAIEIAAMIVGGVSLFLVCFLGFAALAGVPLNEVAVIGKMFPEPTGGEGDIESAPDHGTPAPELPDREVVAASLGVLSAWTLEPPFSHAELKSLADELKLKTLQLDQRLKRVTEREELADQRAQDLADQFETLDELRAELEAYEADLLLRAQEVERDEEAAAELRARRWDSLARLFSEQDAAEAGRRLQAYTPEEATKILRALDEDLAVEILNTFSGDKYIEYAEAWAAGAPSGE